MLRTTLIGGIFFLIPLVVLAAIIGQALKFTHQLATPLLATLLVESFGTALAAHILSVLLLIGFCFAAGLLAKTSTVGRLSAALDDFLLDTLPPYAMLRAKSGSALNPEQREKLTPMWVRFDDSWQFAFEVERLPDGEVVVFLPGAPDQWSGSVCVVTADRVQALDAATKDVGIIMKRLGRGSTGLSSNLPRE